jgi:hypothetical protein
LLLKLRIGTGVVWRKVYVLSYYLAILLLLNVVTNSEEENKEKLRLQARTANRRNPAAATKQQPYSKTHQAALTRKAAAGK